MGFTLVDPFGGLGSGIGSVGRRYWNVTVRMPMLLGLVLLGAGCVKREESWTVTKSMEGGGSETIALWGEVDPGGRFRYCRQEVREAWELSSKRILDGGGSIREAATSEFEQCKERLIETALTGVERWTIDRELPYGGRIRMDWQRAGWGGTSQCRATVEKPGLLFAETFVEGTQPSRAYDLCLESMRAQENLRVGGLTGVVEDDLPALARL